MSIEMPNPEKLVGQSVSHTELARREKEEERNEKSLQFREIMSNISEYETKAVEESTDEMKELLDSEDIEKTSELSKEYCHELCKIYRISLHHDEYRQSQHIMNELKKFGEFGFDKGNKVECATEEAIESLGYLAEYNFTHGLGTRDLKALSLGPEALDLMKNLTEKSIKNNFEHTSEKAILASSEIGERMFENVPTQLEDEYIKKIGDVTEVTYANEIAEQMINNIVEFGKQGESEQMAISSLQSLDEFADKQIAEIYSYSPRSLKSNSEPQSELQRKIRGLNEAKDRIKKAIESLEESVN